MEYSAAFQRIEGHFERLLSPLEARKAESLNRDWRFFAGEAPAAASEAEFDDSAWRVLDVPHDWSVEGEFSNKHPSSGSGGWLQTGVLWYRKRFTLPENTACGKHFVSFDGVSMHSSVWINGHFLGSHPYGFTPFFYDITPWAKTGENVLAVKADASLQPFSRFYHGAGIFRPVMLLSTGTPHIAMWGVKAETKELRAGRATVAVSTKALAAAYPETQWHGFGGEPQREASRAVELVTKILDKDGQPVAEASSTTEIANFTAHEFRQTIELTEPRLWSVDDPYVYRIHSRLLVGGAVVDDTVTSLGVRKVSWGAGFGFAINGEPVKLKGVCLHQDSGPWGGAVPAKAWARKLMTLKALGCNAIRTAHHPFSDEFYGCCDALGMLVMDEAFDEWRKGWERDYAEQPWGKNTYGYSLWFDQWHETDMRAMLRRDHNHPCVVLWSVGNEIPDLYYAEGVETIKKLVRICKEEDQSRPVTVGAEGQYRLPIHEGILEALDIAGLNYVNLRHPQAYYDQLHTEHPEWVMLGTETFHDPGHIPALKDRPYATGQFLWVGYDYLGEAFDPNETIDKATGGKRLQHGVLGLADVLDTPRAEYWYRQSFWAEQPVVHMSVKTEEWVREWWNQIKGESHWNWTAGDKKTVYCFTNCEELELVLNGVSLGRRKAGAEHLLPMEWEVDYQPGVVEIVGYKAGVRVACHRMETTGAAARLSLEADSMELKADGCDAAHVTIRMTDDLGRVVPGAVYRVTACVEGAGSLLAMANGDMSDADGYRLGSCLTVDGLCMAVVRAGRQGGTIRFQAEAKGLASAELTLTVR